MRHDTTSTRAPRQAPRAAVTLDAFAGAAADSDGIDLRRLAALDAIEVRTRNSCYRMSVLDPREFRVLISGGAFLPVPVEATLAGASAGGSMLKVGWILQGFRLEILHDGQRIVTTRVGEILVNPPGGTPGPF